MADTPKKELTWKDKLEKGVPLNSFDEVKADADFNHRRREREEAEKKRFEALKAAGRLTGTDADFAESDVDEDGNVIDDNSNDNSSKKGK